MRLSEQQDTILYNRACQYYKSFTNIQNYMKLVKQTLESIVLDNEEVNNALLEFAMIDCVKLLERLRKLK